MKHQMKLQGQPLLWQKYRHKNPGQWELELKLKEYLEYPNKLMLKKHYQKKVECIGEF